MNKTKRLGFILASLVLWGAPAAYSQEFDDAFSHEAVEYRDGEISVAFQQTPGVVGAAREVPTSAEAKSEDAAEAADPAGQPLATGERERLQHELKRWSELKQEGRGRIEDRARTLPPPAPRHPP